MSTDEGTDLRRVLTGPNPIKPKSTTSRPQTPPAKDKITSLWFAYKTCPYPFFKPSSSPSVLNLPM